MQHHSLEQNLIGEDLASHQPTIKIFFIELETLSQHFREKYVVFHSNWPKFLRTQLTHACYTSGFFSTRYYIEQNINCHMPLHVISQHVTI